MKKIQFIVAIVFATSLQSFAGDVKIINKGTTFNVLYRSPLVCDTKITIYDANGKEIFREVIQDLCNIVRSYNFSKLPYGEYEIETSNKIETQKTTVSYREPVLEIRKPLFHVTKLSDNRYLLLIPKSNHKVAISITDSNEQIIYTQRTKLTGDFAQVFYMKNAEPNSAFSFNVTSVK